MTTAAEYRKYAQECVQSAREANSDPVRDQFLEIAKLWLVAANRMDVIEALRSAGIGKLRTDGQTPPDEGAGSPYE